MSGDKELQRKAFEDSVKQAAAAIRAMLDVVKDAEHLTAHEIQRGFIHLGKAMTVIQHQALNENNIARTANFSLDEVEDDEPVLPAPVAPALNKPSKRAIPAPAPADDDPTLDLAPNIEVVGKMGDAALVRKEGKATLRVVGDLPPETGNAAPITEENLSLLQE